MGKRLFLLVFVVLLSWLPVEAAVIGQSFILTLPENSSDQALKQWLRATKPAGVMLLAAHVRNRGQIRKLTNMLQQEAKLLKMPPLIIAMDWEGGIVSRPSEMGSFNSIPSPWALAKLGRQACFQAGLLVGQQMRDVGITMNFAPVLDLFGSRILATRCFSHDAEKVAECGVAFARGLMHAGIVPVIKHFPGLGSGSDDTHYTPVTLDADSVEERGDMQPFLQALEAGAPAVMATHAVCPAFGKVPVTRSSTAVNQLRTKNPNVTLITDDFEMQAAFGDVSQEEAIRQALQAGYDYIILSGKPAHQIEILQQLAKQHNLAKKDSAKREPLVPQCEVRIDEAALAAHLATAYLQTIPIPSLQGKKVVMITTDLAKIRPPETWFALKGVSYVRRMLEQYGVQVVSEVLLNPLDEKSEELLAETVARVRADKDVVALTQTVFYGDKPWNTIQRSWIEQFAKMQEQLVMVSLGHSEESTIMPDADVINLGSFNRPLLDALAQRLAKPVLQGADVLVAQLEQHLDGKRIGILCNKGSVTADGRFLPDVVHAWLKSQMNGGALVALFSPEHGLQANHEAFRSVPSSATSAWDCPVFSLHGDHRKPTAAMLEGIDLMVIDLPDVGMRCWTYLSTLDLMLDACAQRHISVLLLNRINPLARWGQQGPVLAEDCRSFVGHLPVPFMHGSTLGELARQVATRKQAAVTVLGDGHADAGAGWYFVPPSPNLMSIDHVFAYPLTVLLEGTNYSEGRGTLYPFLQCGAPWVNAKVLTDKLNALKLPGVYFEPITFTPKKMPGVADNPKHAEKPCHGFFVHILNPTKVQPVLTAQTILRQLFALYPQQSRFNRWGKQYGVDLLWGTKQLRLSVKGG